MGGTQDTSRNSKEMYVSLLTIACPTHASYPVLRLGKPIEHLQAALRAALATAPVGEQLTTIARQISYFFFLSYDAIVWVRPSNAAAFRLLMRSKANSIKFIALKPETSRKVQKTSFQFWFAGILFSIINSVLKTARLAKEAKRLESTKTWGEKDLADEAARETRLSAIKTSVLS